MNAEQNERFSRITLDTPWVQLRRHCCQLAALVDEFNPLPAAWAAEGVEAKIGPGDASFFDFATEYLEIWQEVGEK